MQLSTIILQGAAPSGPFGGGMGSIILMALMFGVMYFFMIRPQAKRAKEQKKFAESMGVGEQVVTTGGIHGRINRSNEDGTLQIEISRGTFMTIERAAVSMEMTAAARKKADSAAGITTTAATSIAK